MLEVRKFRSVLQLPVDDWESVAPRDSVGLEYAHLKAIELSGLNNISPYYLIGYSGTRPIGIAYCFALDMDLSALGNEIRPDVLAIVKTWYPGFMQMRVLECGLLSSIGTTIMWNKGYAESFIRSIIPVLDEIGKEENVDLSLVRDIPDTAYHDFQPLEASGYRPFLGFPAAKMDLRWATFDHYVSELKSDKRHNIRKKSRCLHQPEISVRLIEDFGMHAERLAELWTQVSKHKTDYQHESLTKEYFERLNEYLPERSHIIAVFRHGVMIAFSLCLQGDREYFWTYVGMDYRFRDTYNLYFNMIFESVRMALKTGKKTLNLGITTYDFKLYLGCELEPLVYLIKNNKHPELTEALMEMLKKGIPQPQNLHQSFKEQDISKRVQPEILYDALLSKRDGTDIFTKMYSYTRSDILKRIGMYAYFPPFESAQKPLVQYQGKEIIMLGSNCYLGLSTHPEVIRAAKEALDFYGTGCSGSPILNGTLDLHVRLARSLAEFMRKEDALLCSTGYQTNMAVISALATRGDVVILDERSHASLIDGALLSRATIIRYRHNDMQSLEEALLRGGSRPKLVVADSMFSMEGTRVNLPEVVWLVKKYSARFMLDESHAIGVMGPGGRGVAEQFGLIDEIDIIMGTFSKSLAAQGGFVVGDSKLIDGLRHNARGHIFSASLSPVIVATAQAALNIVVKEPERRKKLLDNAAFLAEGLKNLGYKVTYEGSAIVPVHCGNELLVLALFNKLFEEGVFVNPVLHPAVAKDDELLRLSVMPDCSREILGRALAAFGRVRTAGFPAESNATL